MMLVLCDVTFCINISISKIPVLIYPMFPMFPNSIMERRVLVLLFQTAAWIRIYKTKTPANDQWLEGQDVMTGGLIILITTLTSITATQPALRVGRLN